MRRAKISLLIALLVGLATVILINEIGISRYPASGLFPDGAVRGFYAGDVRSCMGARALAAVGDRTSQWHWHHCARTLVQTQALSSFDLRYWSLMLAGAFTLASALGFALALRFDRPPARVLRGRQLLTGAAARREFARTSKMESRRSGQDWRCYPV